MGRPETRGDRPVRVGVCGLGTIGPVPIQALQKVPGVEVTAISSRSGSRLREVAARFGIPWAGGRWVDIGRRARDRGSPLPVTAIRRAPGVVALPFDTTQGCSCSQEAHDTGPVAALTP